MVIVFVGDKPSAKNTDPKIPFIGTASGKRLRRWITMLAAELIVKGIEVKFLTFNSHADEELENIRKHSEGNALIVTLGEQATKRVTRKLKLPVWKLGHPSPRNRQWNDHNKEVDEIKKLAYYIIKKELNEKQ